MLADEQSVPKLNHHLSNYWLLTIAILLSGTLTLVRLIDVQVIKGQSFLEMAEANRLFKITLPRMRGLIKDRYGQPLVQNYPIYHQISDPDRVFAAKKPISADVALSLMATESGSVETTIRRIYPLGEVLAPVLGYTGAVSAEDLQQDKDLKPIDLVGKQGLEKTFDLNLRGYLGEEIYEINALGQKKRLISTKLGDPGQDIGTAIDPYLSLIAFEAMGNRTGVVLITDGTTGEILSLISKPSYDANLITARYADEKLEKFRQQTVTELFTDERQLFFNRAVSGAYPPGSVFKLVTAAAGLSTAAIDAQTSVIDEGVLKVGDYSYANWYFSQYGGTEGEISLQRAIARSNDIYFYKAAEWIGPNQLADKAREFGYGKVSGIELLGEQAGLVPDVDWKEQVIGERWFLGNTYHFGIGQGNLLVTPLQVNQMTQTLINHGSRCSPRLISSVQADCHGVALEDDHLDLILSGMLDACSSGGTAYPFFPWNERNRNQELSAYEEIRSGAVACKTGTAEFGGSDERGYKKTHGWFVMTVGVNELLKPLLAEVEINDLGDQADTQSRDQGDQNGDPFGADDEAEVEEELADLDADSSAENSSVTDTDDQIVKQNADQTAMGGLQQTSLGAASSLDRYRDHQAWLSAVKKHSFPEKIVMTILVESNEEQPYMEGSRDAAPVAKEILDWMVQGSPVEAAPAVEPPAGVVGE